MIRFEVVSAEDLHGLAVALNALDGLVEVVSVQGASALVLVRGDSVPSSSVQSFVELPDGRKKILSQVDDVTDEKFFDRAGVEISKEDFEKKDAEKADEKR